MNHIGTSIRLFRKERGFKQKQLAVMCGLSTNSICSIENGRHQPTSDNLKKISKALNVPVGCLVLGCITEDDLSDKHKVLVKSVIEPLKEYLAN